MPPRRKSRNRQNCACTPVDRRAGSRFHWRPGFFCDRISATAESFGKPAVSVFCRIDDKHVPLYRVLWISATPHFCGEADCQCEGKYEVALEGGESVWASHDEQKKVVSMIEDWQGGEHGFLGEG